MVHIGIQHQHALMLLAQHLGGDGGIVEITKAAGGIVACMVTGRAAHGVGQTFAALQGLGAGNRALRRPVSGLPGIRPHRATAIGEVAAGFGQYPAQGIRFAHEDIGHHFVAPVIRQVHPFAVCFLQETQIRQRVHGADRGGAGIGRLLHVKTEFTCRQHQFIQARRHFLRHPHFAARIVTFGMVQFLIRMEKCFH